MYEQHITRSRDRSLTVTQKSLWPPDIPCSYKKGSHYPDFQQHSLYLPLSASFILLLQLMLGYFHFYITTQGLPLQRASPQHTLRRCHLLLTFCRRKKSNNWCEELGKIKMGLNLAFLLLLSVSDIWAFSSIFFSFYRE